MINRKIFITQLVTICITGACLAWGNEATKRPVPAPVLQKAIAALDAFVEQKRPQSQGGAVVVIHSGREVYRKVFGHERGKDAPITAETLFPLASASKPIAATVVMWLAYQKKIDLTKPVQLESLVPGIHLIHILSHTTGYTTFRGNEHLEKGRKRPWLLQNLASCKPEGEPGGLFKYNNFIFSLIEDVVTQETKVPFEHHLQTLWKKLGGGPIAYRTVPDGLPIASPHDEDAKTKRQKMLWRVPVNYPQGAAASAGIFTSLNGMIEFLKLHMGYHPEIMPFTYLQQMYEPQAEAPDILRWGIPWPVPDKQVQSFYGLGWRLIKFDTEQGEKLLVVHGGYIRGVGNVIAFMPEYDLGIVFLANQDKPQIAMRAVMHLFGKVMNS